MFLRFRPVRLFAALTLFSALMSTAPDCMAARGGKLKLTVIDHQTRQLVPCRMHLKDERGKPRRVPRVPYWRDHFVFPGEIELKLPRGQYQFEIERGPEYRNVTGYFIIEDNADDTKTVELERVVDMAAEGWWSADLHIHRPVKDVELLMQAEDLHVAPVITWWNERNEWKKQPAPEEVLVGFDGNRYYHVMAGEDERAGGALLYFNLDRPLDITAPSREYPSPMKFVLEARKNPNVWIDVEKPFWWDVPVWLASGKVDSIGLANNHMCRDTMYANEAWGRPRDERRLPDPWGNGQWSQEIYYHVLNCGLRIPPSAGSASGVLPNPVGYDRMYVHVGDEMDYDGWWQAFRAGRVVVTNGPLLRPLVNGELPGHVFRGDEGEELSLSIKLDLATRDPISYLEVIKNGQIEHAERLDDWAKTGTLPPLKFRASGWFLIRTVTDVPHTYRFASTAPYYVEIGASPKRISRRSVQFFLDWVDERIERIEIDDEQQRQEVLAYQTAAREFWRGLLEEANAE